MSFSISGIFKPAKHTEPVSHVAPKAEQATPAPKTDTSPKKRAMAAVVAADAVGPVING
ncbi:hypothetical protein ACNH6B_16180 [Shewanella basaltis]|uniref:hypothetical protein n=1 Tax=Shewanella basaltis TaxID=472183 RepID=UPI003AAE6200